MPYPVALEAILRAEETVSAHFEACWTLQIARFVGAVHAEAFSCCGCGSHCEANVSWNRKMSKEKKYRSEGQEIIN